MALPTRVVEMDQYPRLMTGLQACSAMERRKHMRYMARTDLYFLLRYLMNRKDVENPWLFARCREVQASPNGHLDLWSREHYKSTIITFAKTIQDILASHGEDALTDRELTAVIFAFNRPAAKKFMEQIKQELESNIVLKELFDDVLHQNPQAQSQHWSLDGGIVVQRRGNPKEATLEAYGLVDGMPTGGHWLLRVYDDVITERYARSPEMVAKSIESWELSIALGARGGAERYVGTRYHFNDAYKAIMDRGSAIPRVYPATEDGKIGGKPVYMTQEELDKRLRDMGRATFSSQMLQDPTADDAQTIDREDVQYFDGKSVQGNRYLLIDPAGEQKKSSDYTVMVVLELGADGNLYLIDGIRDRLRLKDRASAVIAFHRKYRPRITGYEKYGMQADIEYLEERQQQEGYRFAVTPVGGNQLSKIDRIKRLVPYIEEQRLYLPKTLWKVDYESKRYDFVAALMRDEIEAFPFCVHDDMLDAISRIFDVNMIWPKQSEVDEKKGERYVRKEQKRRLWGVMAR